MDYPYDEARQSEVEYLSACEHNDSSGTSLYEEEAGWQPNERSGYYRKAILPGETAECYEIKLRYRGKLVDAKRLFQVEYLLKASDGRFPPVGKGVVNLELWKLDEP